MKPVKPLFFFGFLLSCSIAMGGAWDMGPFDNDDALDWVSELAGTNSTSILEVALKDVTTSIFYISAPECSRAVAAAEVVAALAGHPQAEIPDEVVSWVRSNKLVADKDLIALARNAVELVRDSSKSELADLWRDSGANYDDWYASMSDLLKRLS